MNLGISNAQVSAWKRIKTQHIVAATGVALAVSALAGGLTLRNDSSAPSAPRGTAPASLSQPAPPPESFIYIVGSQAEAAELRHALSTAGTETGDNTLRSVFVADSAEAEAQLQVMQGELMQAAAVGFPTTIADLRTPLPVWEVSPATSQAPNAFPLVQEMSNP